MPKPLSSQMRTVLHTIPVYAHILDWCQEQQSVMNNTPIPRTKTNPTHPLIIAPI